jgi:Fe(3+) dicitrate transport protein
MRRIALLLSILVIAPAAHAQEAGGTPAPAPPAPPSPNAPPATPPAPDASPAPAEDQPVTPAPPAPAQTPPAPPAPAPAAPPGPPPAEPAPAPSEAGAAPDAQVQAQATPGEEDVSVSGGEVIEMVDTVPPGSAYTLGATELERFESDDVHKVLAAVPGVYIREEDGYGLRPNIGMRGTGSDRSAKIALMEDGVLIAPAPYSAPAAYYFPMITRMQRVEVLKGPAAIRFGPNTVGGAINLITDPIPERREIALDVAGGSYLYGKGHLVYGDSTERFGWLVDAIKLNTEGFKELDGGGDTGFDKNGVMLKLRASADPAASVYHQLDLKLGYSDEVSNETYTGLTEADFARNPYRRYRATELDRMEWRHYQTMLSHHARFADLLELTTTAYRHDFKRDWHRLDDIAGMASIATVLANPDSGNNAVRYAVLTGAEDSAPEEPLLLVTNSRAFVSQGVQLTARADRAWFGVLHSLELGTRLHYDEIERNHYRTEYDMRAGHLARTDTPRVLTVGSLESTTAWATYYQHKLTVGDWQITGGLRAELITNEVDDHLGENDSSDDHVVPIPGAGVLWQALPELALLAGVHRGFVPASPGSGASPELSVNYEAGLRWLDLGANVEIIGFFSDYQNLLGTCTFSSGCTSEQVGDEFDGGAVHAYGVESLISAAPAITRDLHLPLRLNYTLQRAAFQTTFSSSNPQWGDIVDGDEIPYLPEQQLQLQLGVAGPAWEVSFAGRYVSAMRDLPGQANDSKPSVWTDAATVFDASASYAVPRWGKLYLTINNLLDESHITSYRPYGARPGVPRQIVLGYKTQL